MNANMLLPLRLWASAWAVSRSARYRHFCRQAVLATVGKEEFCTLRQATADAWERNRHGRIGFQAIESAAKDDHFVAEARAASLGLTRKYRAPAELSSEHDVDAGEKRRQPGPRNPAGALRKKPTVRLHCL